MTSKLSRCIALFLLLISSSVLAKPEMKGFSGLLIVLTNEIKGCSIDKQRLKRIVKRENGPFIITDDLSKAGENVGFLSIRLSGFSTGDSCVIDLLYQVKVAVDITHNGVRTEGAISNRSTIGLVNSDKVTEELESVITIWTNELVETWKNANK